MVHRRALSRVEILLLLVIAVLIVGLLAGLVGRMRAEADGIYCRNNLKQLHLGVQNYVSVINRLPPLTDQGEGARAGRGLPSVFANLVPYLEATPWMFRPEQPSNYYNAHSSVPFDYRHKDGTIGTSYGGMANQTWRTFLDPRDATADRLRDVPMTLPDGTTGYYATASYVVNGLLPWGVRGVVREFPAGMENTILFAERPQVCRTAAGEDVYNLWGLGIYSPHMPAFAALTPADPPGLLSSGQVAAAEPLPDEAAADRDAQIRVRIGRRDAESGPPDFDHPIQVIRGSRPCDPRLPGTPHRSGMQVAMADGSVRVFAPDTSPWVFWAACLPEKAKADAGESR